jgi:hypothetical protein
VHVVILHELMEHVGVLSAMDVSGLLLASVVLVIQAAGAGWRTLAAMVRSLAVQGGHSSAKLGLRVWHDDWRRWLPQGGSQGG